MTDAISTDLVPLTHMLALEKLERIQAIVRDHDAYGLSRHHEMVLDLTDALGMMGTGDEEREKP